MKKQITLLFLLSTFALLGQNPTADNSKIYVGKKGLYQIKYNSDQWHEEVNKTAWDAEFGDSYNLLSAYFIEFDIFVSEKHIKSETTGQFKKYGKIRKFNTFKKQINNLTVDYFEFLLDYQGTTCKYQGFIYNGKGGSVELLFAGQLEAMEKNQDSVDGFVNGFSLLN